MSLVVCPECGREKVSDFAEFCPECGYPVKKHCETMKKRKLEEYNKKMTPEQKKAKLEADIKKRLDAIKMPAKPPSAVLGISLIILMWVLAIVLFIPYMDSLNGYFFVIPVIITIIYSGYRTQLSSEYNLASRDLEQYKKEKFYEENALNIEIRDKIQSGKIKKGQKCPNCGAEAVEPITTVERFWSVLFLWLASPKLGKTMKCNRCEYKW